MPSAKVSAVITGIRHNTSKMVYIKARFIISPKNSLNSRAIICKASSINKTKTKTRPENPNRIHLKGAGLFTAYTHMVSLVVDSRLPGCVTINNPEQLFYLLALCEYKILLLIADIMTFLHNSVIARLFLCYIAISLYTLSSLKLCNQARHANKGYHTRNIKATCQQRGLGLDTFQAP